MKRYTPEELAEVLRLHKLWLDDEEGGERANLAGAALTRANLAEANLAVANLAGAYLKGANLAGANLKGANLVRAYLAGANLAGAKNFTPFVEVGPIGSRNDMTRFTPGTGAVVCGCFRGTLDEFEAAVLKTHAEGTEYRRQYLAAISMFRALEEKP
mgnify:FL=1